MKCLPTVVERFPLLRSRSDLKAAGLYLTGQKSLRQSRALTGKRIFGRDDRQISSFAALGDELLDSVSSGRSPAHDYYRKGFHVSKLMPSRAVRNERRSALSWSLGG